MIDYGPVSDTTWCTESIPLEQETQIVAQARAVCVIIALYFDAAHPARPSDPERAVVMTSFHIFPPSQPSLATTTAKL